MSDFCSQCYQNSHQLLTNRPIKQVVILKCVLTIFHVKQAAGPPDVKGLHKSKIKRVGEGLVLKRDERIKSFTPKHNVLTHGQICQTINELYILICEMLKPVCFPLV